VNDVKFLDISLHIGSRDIQYIFERLGHSLDVWSISDHHNIMGWPRAQVDIINQNTWRNLDQQMCDDFYNRYKSELSQYDGFVTYYSPTFTMLYEKFNKPIIMYVPLRYETPFHNNKNKLQYFNEYTRKGIDKGKIIPLVTNKYDQKYLSTFINRKFELLPSLCDYLNLEYIGKNNAFLFCSKYNELYNFIKNPNVINKNNMGLYKWEDTANYKAIIHIPYSNTIVTLFEQYTMNIPLLFPSHEFLCDMRKQFGHKNIMSEISWGQVHKLPSKSMIECDFYGGYDPNNYEDLESFQYWSKYSDFYDDEWMPFIEHFDSFQELEYKLNYLDFQEISDKMKKFNIERKKNIMNKWKEVLDKL